jgi:hypothetical protein
MQGGIMCEDKETEKINRRTKTEATETRREHKGNTREDKTPPIIQF